MLVSIETLLLGEDQREFVSGAADGHQGRVIVNPVSGDLRTPPILHHFFLMRAQGCGVSAAEAH